MDTERRRDRAVDGIATAITYLAVPALAASYGIGWILGGTVTAVAAFIVTALIVAVAVRRYD